MVLGDAAMRVFDDRNRSAVCPLLGVRKQVREVVEEFNSSRHFKIVELILTIFGVELFLRGALRKLRLGYVP